MIDRGELLKRVRKARALGWRNQPLQTIVLWHLPENGGARLVCHWDNNDPEFTDGDDTLASKMIEAATGESATLDGRYDGCFCFYFGEADPNNPSRGYGGRFAFRIHGMPAYDNGGTDLSVENSNLGTTEKGVGKLATGFAIDLMKLTIPALHETNRQLSNQISRLEAANETLMNKQAKTVLMYERLLDRKHQRDLLTRKYMFWEQQKEKAAEILFAIAPPILAAFAGRPMLGNVAQTPSQMQQTFTFKQFIKSLEMPQLQALQQRLKPHQLVPIGQMVAAVTSGQEIQPVVLKAFLQTIDEEQARAFEEVLRPEQIEMFKGALRLAYQEYQEAQAKAEQARTDMENEAEESPEDPDDVFNRTTKN